ncbi:MAG: prepilin-type N-terminal cleavage/methylation domain-containing protein [Alphaproteobacteria bacterium]|nr:prepilin-type N-terminal cleavage/methylation domain-containing protein [Alphaproteobacteria bacterium]
MICRARNRKERRVPREDEGFSLIEMLAVLVILSLIGWLSLSLNPLRGGGRSLELSARELSGALRNVRRQAIAGNRIETVEFDVNSRAYATANDRRRKLPAGVGLDITTANTARTGPSTVRLRFYPDGSSTGGRVVLRDRQRRIAIEIDWLTGAIEMTPGV